MPAGSTAIADLHVGQRQALPIMATAMPLIVPFASTVSESGRHTLQSLALPYLERLLNQLTPTVSLGSDEYSLCPPHELAAASVLGWPVVDGALPWAAQDARQAGFNLSGPEQAGLAWARLTPVHLHLGTDRVSLTNPAELQLGEADSRELLEAVRDLFQSEGFGLHWLAAAAQWLATHPLFDGLATASLDRVIGRNVDLWLPDQASARLLRRLQNEVQMLLYTHPLNDRREAAGLPTANSFWCSGCGRAAPASSATVSLHIDDRLRDPALAEDWAAWSEAWARLDAGPLRQLLGSGAPITLWLCGERLAQCFESQPRGWWQRVQSTWQRPSALQALEAL